MPPVAPPVRAEPIAPAAMPPAPPATAEIEALFAAFVESYERGRADAFAALFDDDAETNLRQGRAAIRGEYDELFRLSRLAPDAADARQLAARRRPRVCEGRDRRQDRVARRSRGRAAPRRRHGARAARRARRDRKAVAPAQESVTAMERAATRIPRPAIAAIAIVVALVLAWRVARRRVGAAARGQRRRRCRSRAVATRGGRARRAAGARASHESDRLRGAGHAGAGARATGRNRRCARRDARGAAARAGERAHAAGSRGVLHARRRGDAGARDPAPRRRSLSVGRRDGVARLRGHAERWPKRRILRRHGARQPVVVAGFLHVCLPDRCPYRCAAAAACHARDGGHRDRRRAPLPDRPAAAREPVGQCATRSG